MEMISDVEIWKTLIDGEYEISNLGRIKSLAREYLNSVGNIMPLKERILSATLNNYGYLRVSLNFNGHQKTEKIHRLVAITFLDNPNNLPEVNHKDGNKQNNRVENLEWCNRAYNNRHALDNGLKKTKLKESDILEIRRKASEGTPLRQLAKSYAIVEGTIWNIVNYKIWKQVA
jgi:hypothetical protein